MVLVALVHIADARHRSLLEISAFRQRLLAVALRVRLRVGLVNDVEAVVVAQTVQFRRVRIVARAYRVDVVGFHQQDVFLDALVGHVTRLRVVLVAVHPTDGHGHPVHLQLSVFDADVAETNVHRHIIEGIALVILQDYPKGIQIGVFGIPMLYIRDGEMEMNRRDAINRVRWFDGLRVGNDGGVIGRDKSRPYIVIFQFYGQTVCFAVGNRIQILHRHLHIQNPVFICRIQIGHHLVIQDVRFGLGVEGDAALDAAQPPEILALEVGTVAPLEDLEGDEVALPELHEAGDVELGVGLGVLAVAHELAVHPEVETGLCSADIDDHLLVLPRLVNVHPFAVAAHGVAFHGNFRQLTVVEVVGGVHIDGHAVAYLVLFSAVRNILDTPLVQFPVVRNKLDIPSTFTFTFIVIRAEKIRGALVSIRHIVERHPIDSFKISTVNMAAILWDIGPRVELVDLEHGGILPFGEGLRGEAEAKTIHYDV